MESCEIEKFFKVRATAATLVSGHIRERRGGEDEFSAGIVADSSRLRDKGDVGGRGYRRA